ncbi:hypothetical protein Arub01_17670 [Actinomadura rubrobrunea]|uniref:Uncharacterized protein n=1 Tax=Actinomadura rubrobrunea TaxID=115335 RepID=A0A9W6PV08_9ACTN|nr:hypothetical protein Arub01_17670 [Actinomadura rubrobrunea]
MHILDERLEAAEWTPAHTAISGGKTGLHAYWRVQVVAVEDAEGRPSGVHEFRVPRVSSVANLAAA